MKTDAKSIIGKTITGIITRPSNGRLPAIMVLQFSDGSCFEFVSPAARRAVTRHSSPALLASKALDTLLTSQLSIFPLDGESHGPAALPAAVA